MVTLKSREATARRRCQRRGLVLRKARRFDPSALDYAAYLVLDAAGNVVFGHAGFAPPKTTLTDVERWLDETAAPKEVNS